MSKGKKQPQKGKTIKLSDAILQYNLKNYTGALTRLRAAQIKPDEAAKAQNLQYALTCFPRWDTRLRNSNQKPPINPFVLY